MEYRLKHTDELYHYGVKGMKWGVRHDPEKQGIRDARAAYRQANKDYNKAFNKSYRFSSNHPVTQYIKKSKNYEKSNELWGDTSDKLNKVWETKKDVKKAKLEYKQLQKKKIQTYKDLEKRTNAAYAKENEYWNRNVKSARKAMGGNPLTRTIRSIKASKKDKGYQAYSRAIDKYAKYSSRPGNGDELWTKKQEAYQALGKNEYQRWYRAHKRG